MEYSKFKKFLASFLLIIFSFGLFSPFVYAEEEPFQPTCDAETLLYQQAEQKWGLDIRRTVNNFITGVMIAFFAGVTGINLVQAAGCEYYFQENYGINFSGGYEVCRGTDPAICQEIDNTIKFTDSGTGGLASSPSRQSVRGSLLGLSYAFENVNRYEPLAVNLAYFWNRNMSKLPVVGKTFAADTASGYNLPLLNAAFSLWTFVRNIALAMMSLVLLYTGIMIILRKKVSSQLVVSVQYAIPKIVVGLLLIIFSYPIGAAIVGISWGLYRGAFSLVFDALVQAGPGLTDNVGASGAGAIFLGIMIAMVRYGSVGIATLFVIIIALIATFLLWLSVQIKALFLYLKLVIGVVSAPLEIALGTLPGSEDKISGWFKKMAKHGVSVVALGISVPMVLVLAYKILIAYGSGTDGGNAETAGTGRLMRIIVPLLVTVYGFMLALNIDKTVGAFFGDDGKKKK